MGKGGGGSSTPSSGQRSNTPILNQPRNDPRTTDPNQRDADNIKFSPGPMTGAPAGGGGGSEGGFEFDFDFPDMPDWSARNAAYEAGLAAQLQAQGESERDTAYGHRSTAAEQAVSYVGGLISSQRSKSALQGIDYQITEEQQTQQVNDYFATLWSEADETRLGGLMKTWGKPEGFKDFTIVRGDSSKFGTKDGSSKSVGVSKSQKPKIAQGDSPEGVLGGAQTVLGG